MAGALVDLGVTPRLHGKALLAFLELACRGYTVNRIRELMAAKGYDLVGVPDAMLINLMRSPEVKATRKELDGATLKQFGLAAKLERVRRLCEAAETIEKHAADSTRWSREYRCFLNQIRDELDPLEIEITPGDSWAVLLEKLGEIAQEAKHVDKSECKAAGDDS